MEVAIYANHEEPEIAAVAGKFLADGSRIYWRSHTHYTAGESEKMDLVLIAPDADPPVCKVMDYGKHLFELKKQKSAQRKKQKQIQVKEMKFRPGTEEGDYQVKLRNLIRFLGDGDKAKVSLRFRGREMVHPEIGMQLMQRIEGDLQEHGSVEAQARFEGRQVTMVLAPKKKKK